MGVAAYRTVAVLAILAAAALWQQPALAQESPITAEVDSTRVTVNDSFTLTVTVTGPAEVQQPALPSFQGITINLLSKSTASQLRIFGGQTTAQRVTHYLLQPTSVGTLRIGRLSVTIDGEEHNTPSINVEVTAEPAPAAPSLQTAPTRTPIPTGTSVEAVVDLESPYVGQQVVFTLRYFRTPSYLRRPDYEAPDFTGFWRHQNPTQRWLETTYSSRSYRMVVLNTIIFPTLAGPATIGPATIRTHRIDRFGRRSPVSERFYTEPLSLHVRPLPPGAPDGFAGAVGKLGITSSVDSSDGAVNEPVILTVVLSGEGGIETLPHPVLPDLPQWRSFDSPPTIEAEAVDDTLAGRRVYQRTFLPEAQGEFTIPAISYSYFDPFAETYETVSTDPIEVTIAPGNAEAPVAPLPDVPRAQVERLAADIRHIKPAPAVLEPGAAPLTERGGYWIAWGLPLVILLAGVGWRLRTRIGRGDAMLVRMANAQSVARERLELARMEMDGPHAAAGRALTSYLGDKLGRPVTGLTHTGLSELLARRGVDDDLTRRVRASLASAEGAQFSSGEVPDSSAEELLAETENIIADLERGLGA